MVQKYVAVGVWGLLFGVVGLFLFSQSFAQPKPSPTRPKVLPVRATATPTTQAHPTQRRAIPAVPSQGFQPLSTTPLQKSPPYPTISAPKQTGSTKRFPTHILRGPPYRQDTTDIPQSADVSKAKVWTTQQPTVQRDLPPLLVGLYVFLLAIFLGFELISKVPPTLHTPLMSGSNAISGITIIGALYCTRSSSFNVATVLGVIAVIFAMINVVGGYLVTDRMLRMFRK